MMTETGYMTAMTVTPLSAVNGARTSYMFEVIPNFDIQAGDSLILEFPPEIEMPLSQYIQCNGDDTVAVSSCRKTNSITLMVTFGTVSEDYEFITIFRFFLQNILNPTSFKPSGKFTGIYMQSQAGNMLTQYADNSLYV